ncbi:MAG: thiamine-phosphate kinase, partial [Gemmatimonadetes bacterium]|nr:thiamine-phosphate kinase [Gemmatimonadota bacterium]
IQLVERGVVHALIDLSDGLAGDAGHLAAASGVKIVLEAGRIPVAEAARAALGDNALDAALHGGEDYELCFAAPAGAVRGDELSIPLTCVGHAEAGTGVWLDEGGGAPRLLERGGYSHLVGGAP